MCNFTTRKLATATRWRVRICIIKFLARPRGVVDPVNCLFAIVWPPCKTWLFGVIRVGACRRLSKSGGAGAPLPWDRYGWTLPRATMGVRRWPQNYTDIRLFKWNKLRLQSSTCRGRGILWRPHCSRTDCFIALRAWLLYQFSLSVRPSVRSILVLRRNGCRHRQTFHQLVSYGQSRPLHSTQSNGLDWPSPTIFPHYVPCVQKKWAN